jgi:hypothetical protein
MATLIAVYNSEGLVGRCDAKCYNAADSECVCICGGANHGAGYDKAVTSTMDMVEYEMENLGLTEQLEQFKRLRGLNGKEHYTVEAPLFQPALPGFDVAPQVVRARR